MDDITKFLCAVLRNEPVSWPEPSATNFYQEVLDKALHHGVDAMLCHGLRATPDWGGLPGAFTETLQQRLRSAAMVEMARREDLLGLLEAFRSAGIDVLMLKGAALAYTHYAEPHLRTRVDTDVLVAPQSIEKVAGIFRDAGYQATGMAYKSHQFSVYRRDHGVTTQYDVHWRANNHAAYARIIDHAEALEHAAPLPGLPGALTLDPVRALLLACSHLAASDVPDPYRLVWLYDVHLLVTGMNDSQLREFADLAIAHNIQGQCLAVLQKTADCLHTMVPGPIQAAFSVPPPKRTLARRFETSQMALLLNDWKVLPDRHSRLRMLREFFFPPGAYLLGRYGKKRRAWLPLLYVRYLLGGVIRRLSLR